MASHSEGDARANSLLLLHLARLPHLVHESVLVATFRRSLLPCLAQMSVRDAS